MSRLQGVQRGRGAPLLRQVLLLFFLVLASRVAHVRASSVYDPETKKSIPINEHRFMAHTPFQPVLRKGEAPGQETIFVGLASFRDPRCAQTLLEIFKNAENPSRVTVGVVQQNAEGYDSDCLESYCQRAHMIGLRDPSGQGCPFADQIVMDRVDFRQATGPTWARHRQGKLLEDQQFCLSMDSHSFLDPNWDRLLIEDWLMTENEYGILTTYIPDASNRIKPSKITSPETYQVPHLCNLVWGGGGMVRNAGAAAAVGLTKPKLGSLWAAGFSFSKCHAELTVPVDCCLPHIFDGEEYSRAARFWTSGYDFYTPYRNRVYHDYSKKPEVPRVPGAETFRNLDSSKAVPAVNRLWHIMGRADLPPEKMLPINLTRVDEFSLGTLRSMAQFERFSGVFVSNHTIVNGRCGDLDWIPFEDPKRHLWLPGKTTAVAQDTEEEEVPKFVHRDSEANEVVLKLRDGKQQRLRQLSPWRRAEPPLTPAESAHDVTVLLVVVMVLAGALFAYHKGARYFSSKLRGFRSVFERLGMRGVLPGVSRPGAGRVMGYSFRYKRAPGSGSIV